MQQILKVVYDRAHSSIAAIERGMVDWKAAFSGADWFHWTGITPAISANTADVCLEAVQAAAAADLTISCDLNYRKNLWKYGKRPGKSCLSWCSTARLPSATRKTPRKYSASTRPKAI